MTSTSTILKRLSEGFYESFSSKEKESYNISKLISLMADYGYLEHMRVNGDKEGADIIFYRSSDCSVLKIQVKGRMTLKKNYSNKDLFVAFPGRSEDKTCWHIYNHDELLIKVLEASNISETESWNTHGSYSWPRIPKYAIKRITTLEF